MLADYGQTLQQSVPLAAINQTFGAAFASGGPYEAAGSQLGQAAGFTAAGPFGAIVGGMFGSMAGSIAERLMGNTDVDYDISTSASTQGFEDGGYITTPFGNIGFNAGSTRNLSMNKQGAPILRAYAQILGPIDRQLASVLNPQELQAVRSEVQRNIDNSHIYGPERVMKMLLKDRMAAIDKVMSDERKAATGWDDLLATYNAQYPPADRSILPELQMATMTLQNSGSQDVIGLGDRDYSRDAANTLDRLAVEYPEFNQIQVMASEPSGDYGWYEPMGLTAAATRYFDMLDEENARYRV